jgi:hypothetical protein
MREVMELLDEHFLNKDHLRLDCLSRTWRYIEAAVAHWIITLATELNSFMESINN